MLLYFISEPFLAINYTKFFECNVIYTNISKEWKVLKAYLNAFNLIFYLSTFSIKTCSALRCTPTFSSHTIHLILFATVPNVYD